MKFRHWILGAVLTVSLVACGGDTKKKTKVSSNNTANNTVNNTSNNTIDPAKCGNGQLDQGESCDPGIEDGDEGACPTICELPSATACFAGELTGSADNCTAACVSVAAACSLESDGCCSLGCDSSSDSDCTNECGNGTVEAGETCDGNCPTSCDDNNACTSDSFTGSPDQCSFQCVYTAKTACTNNDGCCPAGCTSANDSDCSDTCGNGQIDANEVCDGDCPTTCNDNNACTRDTLTGAAASCSSQCSFNAITNCQGGDGCCPAGCNAQVDADCNCNPTTSCGAQGLECGTIFNGCFTETCGNCANGDACQNNLCVPSLSIGTACTSDTQCTGSECLPAAEIGWAGGYCSLGCTSNTQCGAGNHCGFRNADNGNQGLCMRGCTSNADCGRSGYACYDRDGDGLKECAATGTGSGAVGAPCSTIQQCAGGNAASCFLQDSEWYQGYCTRSCTSDSDCGANAHCYGDVCLANSCNRPGYQAYDRDGDGRNECLNAGTGAGAVGAPCEGIWNCAGGRHAGCLDEAGVGFPGGYCTILCGAGEGVCTGDSACYNVGGIDLCADGCTSSGQCRSGYQCAEYIGGGVMSCWL